MVNAAICKYHEYMSKSNTPIDQDKIAASIMEGAASKDIQKRVSEDRLLKIITPQSEWEKRLLIAYSHRILNLAISESNFERAHALLDAGVPVVMHGQADDQEGWTILHHMVEGEVLYGDGSNMDILDQFVARPEVAEAINHRTHNGDTALWFAIHSRFDLAAERLIELGARLDYSLDQKTNEFGSPNKKIEWEYICNNIERLPRTVVAYAAHLNQNDLRSPEKTHSVLNARAELLVKRMCAWDMEAFFPQRLDTATQALVHIFDGMKKGADKDLQSHATLHVQTAFKQMFAQNEDINKIETKAHFAARVLDALERMGIDSWGRQSEGTWRILIESQVPNDVLSYMEKERLTRTSDMRDFKTKARPRL